MTVETYFLVINADREARIAKKPRLGRSEIAYKLSIDFPASWGKVVGEISLTAPEFVAEVTVDES